MKVCPRLGNHNIGALGGEQKESQDAFKDGYHRGVIEGQVLCSLQHAVQGQEEAIDPVELKLEGHK